MALEDVSGKSEASFLVHNCKTERYPGSPFRSPCPQAVYALLLGDAHRSGLKRVINGLPAVRGVLERPSLARVS